MSRNTKIRLLGIFPGILHGVIFLSVRRAVHHISKETSFVYLEVDKHVLSVSTSIFSMAAFGGLHPLVSRLPCFLAFYAFRGWDV